MRQTRTLPAMTPTALALGLFVGSHLIGPSVACAKKVKLGTLAPEGSPWHNGLKRTAEKWAKASGGAVELKIYAGGVLGNETDMIRKMRIGQLHAGSVTGIGLGVITKTTLALQVPMMMHSYEELDHVRAKIGPQIEREMNQAGFVVLSWGDAGWAHFFSKAPAPTVEAHRALKLFVWAGDPDSEAAWRAAQFRAVPMSSTDVMSALQTGLAESFCTTPLYALTSQWFGLAKHMVAVNWTPLNGATIVTKGVWEDIEPGLRSRLLEIAQEEGAATMREVRELDAKSVQAMKDRGLSVHEPTKEELARWQKAADMAHPIVRGRVVPAPVFDEVKRLVDDFRQKKGP